MQYSYLHELRKLGLNQSLLQADQQLQQYLFQNYRREVIDGAELQINVKLLI